MRCSLVKCFQHGRSQCDVVIVGGGIIGTAIARCLKIKYPQNSVVLLEKENSLGLHQSSHNSGVIHAGIYYKPGSLKAKLCVQGLELINAFCNEKNVPCIKCGKLIVATNDEEINSLNTIYRSAIENKVPGLVLLKTQKEIQTIEPNCYGVMALWSPYTGNTDWKIVTQQLGEDFRKCGGDIRFLHQVNHIKENNNCDYPIIVSPGGNDFIEAKYLVKCGGLHSEKLSNLNCTLSETKILSFRVNYNTVKPKNNDLIRTNVYAVPNLPFLGPHFSPRLDGSILVGPSAIPALNVEGYRPDDISLPYLRNAITYTGFQKMVLKNLSQGIFQLSKFISNNVRGGELKQILPAITEEDISPGPCAVQAQAINSNGDFVDDYIIECFQGTGINKRIIDCKFIPSPGATSCLAIADYVVNKMPKII